MPEEKIPDIQQLVLTVKRHLANPRIFLVDAVLATQELAEKRRKFLETELGGRWEIWTETYNYYTKEDW